MDYPSEDIYEGMWENDRRHGQGELAIANGDDYIGSIDYSVSFSVMLILLRRLFSFILFFELAATYRHF